MIRLKALALAAATATLIIIAAMVLSFVTESNAHAAGLPTPFPTLTSGPGVVPSPAPTPWPKFTGGPKIQPVPPSWHYPAATHPGRSTSNTPRNTGVQPGAKPHTPNAHPVQAGCDNK